MIVVVDTSGLVTALDLRSPERSACAAVLQGANTVVLSPMVVSEADHVSRSRFGGAANRRLMSSVVLQARRMRFLIPQVTAEMIAAAHDVQLSYGVLDLDMADAVNVVLAAEYRTDAVLTLDRRDFRAVRPLTHHAAFRVLPDDL